jgi:DNA-binding response OmpR family regulator
MDGRAGLDSFHTEVPFPALLDLHLPELSGKHLCKEMKAAEPSIPIVIPTVSRELDDRVTLLEMVPIQSIVETSRLRRTRCCTRQCRCTDTDANKLTDT